LTEQLSVGFAGLGDIGSAIAMRILDCGARLTVYNRTMSKTEPFAARGACVAISPVGLVAADVIVTALLGPDSDREVYEGPDGLLSGDVSGKLFINTATVGPQAARRLGRVVEGTGARYVDAVLLGGGRTAALRGELLLPVGASAKALRLARPVLCMIANRIEPLGPVGAAQTVKLVNNLQVAVHSAVMAEALRIAFAAGIDRETLARILPQSSSRSRSMELYLSPMLFGPYSGRGTLKTITKDLALALALADALGVECPIGRSASFVCQDACGAPDLDTAALINSPRPPDFNKPDG
jgi:3-hydroxyisobutyrate dehydrogenase-like beta-hydroxyacid dehydrogenase